MDWKRPQRSSIPIPCCGLGPSHQKRLLRAPSNTPSLGMGYSSIVMSRHYNNEIWQPHFLVWPEVGVANLFLVNFPPHPLPSLCFIALLYLFSANSVFDFQTHWIIILLSPLNNFLISQPANFSTLFPLSHFYHPPHLYMSYWPDSDPSAILTLISGKFLSFSLNNPSWVSL